MKNRQKKKNFVTFKRKNPVFCAKIADIINDALCNEEDNRVFMGLNLDLPIYTEKTKSQKRGKPKKKEYPIYLIEHGRAA